MTVNVTVNAVNDGPIANNDVMNTTQNTSVSLDVVSANDTDVDGDALTVTEINGGTITAGGASVAVANGMVSLAADSKTLTFTPDTGYTGAIAFNYTITDGALTDTANVTGSVSVATTTTTVNPVVPPPSGTDDPSSTFDSGSEGENELSADGAVLDAVASANKLGGGTELGADGAVLDAVSGTNNLGGTTGLGADGAVLEAVENANGQRIYFGDNVDSKLADSIGLWDAQGVKGFAVSFSLTETGGGSENIESLFPLRVGGIEAEARDQLLVKSILRDRTLFLEVDYTINSDPNLLALSINVLQVNGDPLPEWLRVDDKGRLVSGEPPVGAENVEIRIEVNLSDGTQVIRYVDVNVNSGEIASLGQISDEIIAGASLFENQIEKEAIKFDNDSKELEKSLFN